MCRTPTWCKGASLAGICEALGRETPPLMAAPEARGRNRSGARRTARRRSRLAPARAGQARSPTARRRGESASKRCSLNGVRALEAVTLGEDGSVSHARSSAISRVSESDRGSACREATRARPPAKKGRGTTAVRSAWAPDPTRFARGPTVASTAVMRITVSAFTAIFGLGLVACGSEPAGVAPLVVRDDPYATRDAGPLQPPLPSPGASTPPVIAGPDGPQKGAIYLIDAHTLYVFDPVGDTLDRIGKVTCPGFADDDDLVRSDRAFDFGHDIPVIFRDLVSNGRVRFLDRKDGSFAHPQDPSRPGAERDRFVR